MGGSERLIPSDRLGPNDLYSCGMDLELRHLRYFVAVAEELSFTRAAQRLHMAQPPLSRAIQNIEEHLGADLLIRTTRSVELTATGAALLEEARTVLSRFDEAVTRVTQAGRVDRRDLRIGFRPAASLPLLEPVVREFRRRFPEVAVDPIRIEWSEQEQCLREGTADVAFILGPVDHPAIEVTPLLAAPRAVGMPLDHRLSHQVSISIDELKYDAMAVPAGATREWEAFWTAMPRPIDPSVGPAPRVSNADESLAVVLSGQALVITISTVRTYYKDSSLSIVPISDIAPAVIGLATLRGTSYSTVAAFRQVAQEMAGLVAVQLELEAGTHVAGPSTIDSIDLNAPLMPEDTLGTVVEAHG